MFCPSPFRLTGISLVEDCGKAKLDRAATAFSRLTGNAELWKPTHRVAQRRRPRIPLPTTQESARCHSTAVYRSLLRRLEEQSAQKDDLSLPLWLRLLWP